MPPKTKGSRKENTPTQSGVGDNAGDDLTPTVAVTGTVDLQQALHTLQEKIDEEVENNQAEIQSVRSDTELLKAIVVEQSHEISTLRSTVTDLQTRSMNENVLFHNIKEIPNEDCKKVVTEVLK